MSPAVEREFAVSVSLITGRWENYQPVFSPMISKEPTTVLLKNLLRLIRKEDAGGENGGWLIGEW